MFKTATALGGVAAAASLIAGATAVYGLAAAASIFGLPAAVAAMSVASFSWGVAQTATAIAGALVAGGMLVEGFAEIYDSMGDGAHGPDADDPGNTAAMFNALKEILGGDFGADPAQGDPTGTTNDIDCDNPFLKAPVSPLVIDLDGDGIELTALPSSSTFFDLNVDGFAENTGWVHGDDALLALDINGNGTIDDNSELFGNATGFENGFVQLAELDSNGDGVIDANDEQFSDLLVWQDFDQDGISDDGEVQTLSEAGIVSIDLNAEAVDETNEGHLISDRSTLTFSNGTVGVIEDVHFQNDPSESVALLPEDFEYDPEALVLPVLFGYGQLPSTLTSMSIDSNLKAQAHNLLELLSNGDVTGFIASFEAFILDWADVSGVDPTSRGPHIDARHLAFLEKVHGAGFVGALGHSDPGEVAGPALEEFYQEFLTKLASWFLAQSAGASALLETEDFEGYQSGFDAHPLSVFASLTSEYSPEKRSLDGELSTVLSGLQDKIDSGGLTTANAVAAIMLLEPDFGSDSEDFHLLLQVGIAKAGLAETSDLVVALTNTGDLQVLEGTTGNDSITANSASHIKAGAGDDVVTGSSGRDLISGGEGDDTLNGSSGADVYIYSLGDGSDTIKDYSTKGSENDRLVFTDVNADDVTFSQNSGKDLIITLSNGDTITITDHFDNGWEDMELIEFADGTVLDLAGIAAKTISDQNGDGNDVVRGSSGADTFHGGVGNDTLIGGTGADTYIYSLGDGSDTIKDYSTRSEDDRLVFTDVNADDVSFSQNSGKDLIITLSNGDTVTVTDHFDGGWENMELIEFADGTVLNLAEITAKAISDQNGDGDDVVLGSNYDDTFHGGVGNDTLKGGAGSDTYIYSLGNGNDTINDNSSNGTDRLIFTDVNADDVTFSQNAGKDLVITLSNGETVTITDHFDNSKEQVELIEFADGTVLDLAGITAKSIDDQNGDGDDVVLGSNYDDTFYGGVGNDTLKGGAGSDTYIYSLGNGSDTINDNSSYGTDRLVFTDVNADDATFSQNAGEDLVITLSNGETV
ncbi:calcium-binding protein, partial [Ruegeria arenilitoris]|uniref:calcium-binding protein n=1 Tax=Ruegeria arenilitoris TaxID=1173585 RepID=UPI00267042C5